MNKVNTGPTPAQQWRIISNGNGTYRIISYMSDTRGLDVAGGSSDNLANVALYTYSGSSNQRWVFKPQKKIYENRNANTSFYNRSAAADYATRYAVSNNSQYLYLLVGDCTNFVSQCLYAGGFPYINNGTGQEDINSWYYATSLLGMKYEGSNTWSYAPSFAKHWGRDNNGEGNQRVSKTIVYYTLKDAYNDWNYIYANAYNGDVFQIPYRDGIVHHTMIVQDQSIHTDYLQYDIQYAQHTSNKIDSLYYYLSKNKDSLSEGFILHKI